MLIFSDRLLLAKALPHTLLESCGHDDQESSLEGFSLEGPPAKN